MNNQNCAKALELSKIALDEVNSSSLSCIGNTVLQSSVGFTYAILKQTIEEDLLDIPVNQEKLTISDTILDKLGGEVELILSLSLMNEEIRKISV